MVICGIKLTHDGAIALIDNGRLVFSYEMEKLSNSPRYSRFFMSMQKVDEILSEHGYTQKDIDRIVIDGWDSWDDWKGTDAWDESANDDFYLEISPDDIHPIKIRVAGYGHVVGPDDNILERCNFRIPQIGMPYSSYQHVSSHVAGAYCTSPFAARKEDAYILVWDGGMPPQLFYYRYRDNTFRNLGHLFLLGGYMYMRYAYAFKPFSLSGYGLEIAGKAMAYVALGNIVPEVMAAFRQSFDAMQVAVGEETVNMRLVDLVSLNFIDQAKKLCDTLNIRHEDMLATFHAFVQELLVEHLSRMVERHPGQHTNLCFAGGSALNIKWNSAIRASGIFREVWVPPFPNDAGSAIGTACCEMMVNDRSRVLEWNVYGGPLIRDSEAQEGEYTVCPCDVEQLAYILYKYDEPMVFLNGRAELGPRALGNRSILAPASSPGMKALLNKIKGREGYRPVAPICLERDAPEVFDPGTPDPYMLYEHRVRAAWKDKVPAICHLDGSARLQTVNRNGNDLIYQLLIHYKDLSGIPLLCNTSANFNGKGFFPDVKSAMQWGKVNFIWSGNRLYYRNAINVLRDLIGYRRSSAPPPSLHIPHMSAQGPLSGPFPSAPR